MNIDTTRKYSLLGFGSPVVDILVEVDDAFIAEANLRKGQAVFMDESAADTLLEKISHRKTRVLPGGAAANVTRGVSLLGGTTSFVGTVGRDTHGSIFADTLGAAGVITALQKSDLPSSFAITCITPDHERSFAAHLGASTEVTNKLPEEIDLADCSVAHFEGYQLEGETGEITNQVIQTARAANVVISLDLNDASLYKRNEKYISEVVANSVDILFVNEPESIAFTGLPTVVDMIEYYKKADRMTVLKCGAEGAYIIADGEVTQIAAVGTTVVDTTGAGDLFAAGFIYGLTSGQSIAQAGTIGAQAASAVIQKIGVDLSDLSATS